MSVQIHDLAYCTYIRVYANQCNMLCELASVVYVRTYTCLCSKTQCIQYVIGIHKYVCVYMHLCTMYVQDWHGTHIMPLVCSSDPHHAVGLQW